MMLSQLRKRSFKQWSRHVPTFRTVSVSMWVFGVLRDTLRTITQFITTMVVTDITNIRYLQSEVYTSVVHHCYWNETYINLLSNERHCF